MLEFGGHFTSLRELKQKNEKYIYTCCSQLNHSLYRQYRFNVLLLQNKPTDAPAKRDSAVSMGVSNFFEEHLPRHLATAQA